MSNYLIQRVTKSTGGGPGAVDFVDPDTFFASGMLFAYPTTLGTQTIAAGYTCEAYGPLTIPSGVTLTVNGVLYVDSRSLVTL